MKNTFVKKQFIIAASELKKCTNLIKWAINKKTPLPVLENYLIVVNNDTATIRATDLESTAEVKLWSAESETATWEGTKGEYSFIINPIVLKGRDDDEVLTFDIVAADKLKVTSTDKSKVELVTYPFDEFPIVGNEYKKCIYALSLREPEINCLSKAHTFIGKDEIRPVMSGVCINFLNVKKELRIAGTDAHSLYMAARPVKLPPKFTGERLQIIIPSVICQQITKFESCHLQLLPEEQYGKEEINISQYGIISGYQEEREITIYFRAIDGRYPNYESVIPETSPIHAEIKISEMIASLTKAMVYSHPTTSQVNFNFSKKETIISSQDKDFAHSYCRPIHANYNHEPLEISFNGTFLQRLLKKASENNSDTTQLNLTSPTRCATIETTSSQFKETYLIMPIQINN